MTVAQPEKRRPYHYPIALGSRLPTIKVPLRPHDVPARLNLQELIDKAYAMGRYDLIDYGKPCVPMFDGVEKP